MTPWITVYTFPQNIYNINHLFFLLLIPAASNAKLFIELENDSNENNF